MFSFVLLVFFWGGAGLETQKTSQYLELEKAGLHTDPEYPKQAQWVTCLVRMLAMTRTGMFSAFKSCAQILATC